MVDLSLVHAMAAPSDPFSLKLQQHSRSNPNPNSNNNPWGTWEELLLGRAVLKHGADNWALVSTEVQSRSRASFSFTPEACRAGYQAIKRRFGADEGRDGSAAHWYEELRQLRVAHLRRELQQCDSSIGSLENKIKRLQSEESARPQSLTTDSRAKESTEAHEPTLQFVGDESARVKSLLPETGRESTEAFGPTLEVVVHESHVCGTEKPHSNMAKALGDVSAKPKDGFALDRSSSHGTTELPTRGLGRSYTSHTDDIVSIVETPTPALMHPSGKAAPAPAPLSNGGEELVLDKVSASQCNGVTEPAFNHDRRPMKEQPLSSSNTLQMNTSKSHATTLKSNMMVQGMSQLNTQLRRDHVETGQEVGRFESGTAAIFKRSHDGGGSNHMATMKITEHNNRTRSNEMLNNERGGQSETHQRTGHLQLASQAGVSLNLGDTLQGDVSAKQGVSPSSKSVNIEDCKNLGRAKACVCVVDGGEKSEESESLCSPRLKSSPTNKRRRSPGFGKDARLPDDDDDKRMVRKSVGEKSFLDALSSLPVESADSTEGKGQEALAGKTSCLEPLTVKVKKEILACKEEDEIVPGLGAVKFEGEHSRRLSTGPLNAETRNHSPSSTENSLLHEVWGESVEADDKEMKRANKRRRLLGRDRKRKATTFNTDLKDVRGIAEPPRQVEFAVKTESMTTSPEASESMHSPVGTIENDIEAWHQAERLSGDSRFEKSEMGSYVDGNEDISPMSRRNRREPKVSGKLIPLLESLRTICAHRCAHFFRHNQEPEENQMYYCMVRMPIDLGMIRAKLEEGQYSGSMHFFRDLLLMVSNALVYYSRDSSEAAAASGLRECIVKEMGHVFETEVLVKQEGPSFRKRDVRQLAAANQGRRKGGHKLLSAMEKPSRDLTLKQPSRDLTLKQSDVSTSVESRRPSHQILASRFDERARSGDVKKLEGKRSFNIQTTHEASRLAPGSLKAHVAKEPGLKLGSTLEKANEVKDPGSDKSSINIVSKDAKLKHRVSESGVEKKGEFTKVGSTSKASASTINKGIESSGRKMKVAPDVVQEPVKRGVGRPPKHSQQHGLQKPREIEVPNSTRKRAKR